MIVSAHQPHFFPWIGYFNKIYLSDVFMLMDNINYTSNSYIARNRILNSKGIQYINVPVIKPYGLETKISELKIDLRIRNNWNEKIIRTLIHNYYKGKGFNEFFPLLEPVLSDKGEDYIKLSKNILVLILEYLQIHTKIIFASKTNTCGKKETDLIVNIIQDSKCKGVLLGLGASVNYVDNQFVKKQGYEVYSQSFKHPIYTQKTNTHFSGISVIDLLFNVTRDEAIKIVKRSGSLKRI
jgi:hypothetical protein